MKLSAILPALLNRAGKDVWLGEDWWEIRNEKGDRVLPLLLLMWERGREGKL